MGNLNTTVVASFTTDDASTGLPEADRQRWILEASNRPSIVKMSGFPLKMQAARYFLVFPAANELIFVTSSGTVSASVPTLQKKVYETLTFQGGDPWVVLKYPKPKDVVIQLVGTLLPAKPPYTDTITMTYDALRNIVKASRACFGIVTVEYHAPYDLWLANFPAKAPEPFNYKKVISPSDPSSYPDPEDDQPPTGGAPMLILAKRAIPPIDADPDEIVASLSLDPPGAGEYGDQTTDPTGWSIRLGTDSQMPKLRLMIDPKFPVRLITKGASDVPQAGCNVLCIPDVSADCVPTAGQLMPGVTVAQAPVAEMVTFSGSESTSLQHQPQSSVGLSIIGSFVNKWGHSFSAVIRPPGSTVRVVDWASESEPKNPRERVVGVDELVVTDAFGNAIPAYGIVRATYSITANSREYVFEYDENTKSFKSAWIVGLFSDQTATLSLTGPLLKGVR